MRKVALPVQEHIQYWHHPLLQYTPLSLSLFTELAFTVHMMIFVAGLLGTEATV